MAQAISEETTEHALLLALKKIHEAEEEIAALRQQHVKLKEMIKTEAEQNVLHRQKIDSLNTALQEKDQLLHHFETTQHATPLVDHSSTVEELRKDNELLKQSLETNQQHNKQLERVLRFLREKAETAHLEVQQLQEALQSNHTALEELSQQLPAMQNEATNLQEQLSLERKLKEELQVQMEASKTELEVMREEKLVLEEALKGAKAAQDDRDTNLRFAQQHLAKKMKEVTLLAEKNEEQKAQNAELQRLSAEAQAAVIAIQQRVELQIQHEKQLQKQLEDQLKSTESQLKKWEEKYFQLYDRWQDAEIQNKALKALEEKQGRIQMLLNNLHALMSMPNIIATPQAPPISPSTSFGEFPSTSIIDEKLPQNKSETNRYKQTLFD